MNKHVSLFAGIGMIDYALEQQGFETVLTAEVDPFCQKILQRRYPDALHLGDVREVSMRDDVQQRATARPGRLLVSGGFPCQDVSSSGTAAGLRGKRSGLWSEFRRVIREFCPDYVLIENSPLLRRRGLSSILHDLATLGYAAQWDCIPAASVGAPHLRDRIFVVAVPCGTSHTRLIPGILPRAGRMIGGACTELTPRATVRAARRNTSVRLFPTPTRADGSGGPGATPKREGGKNLRTVIAEEEGNGRLNPEWIEWMMGMPGCWTDPDLANSYLYPHLNWRSEHGIFRTVPHRVKDRSKRIRALGNSVVPQTIPVAIKMIPELEGAIQ